MFAIQRKGSSEICFLTDSKQYLIWDTEEAAWRFLVEKLNREEADKYQVIRIRWTRT